MVGRSWTLENDPSPPYPSWAQALCRTQFDPAVVAAFALALEREATAAVCG